MTAREIYITFCALVVFVGPIVLGAITAPVEYTQPKPADNGDWADRIIEKLFE